MSFTSRGNEAQTVIRRKAETTIDMRFSTPDGVVIPKGAAVKLGSTEGTVELCASGTDECFGMVTVGTKSVYGDNDQVTVATDLMAEVYAEATEAIAVGDKVFSAGVSTDYPSYPKVSIAATGNFISGVALSAATGEGDVIRVGVYLSKQSKK